jgi:hypothetical protein
MLMRFLNKYIWVNYLIEALLSTGWQFDIVATTCFSLVQSWNWNLPQETYPHFAG